MEVRDANIIFNKSGGNASKGSFSTKISLPVSWIREMGLTLDSRETNISFDGNKIIIEKDV